MLLAILVDIIVSIDIEVHHAQLQATDNRPYPT